MQIILFVIIIPHMLSNENGILQYNELAPPHRYLLYWFKF